MGIKFYDSNGKYWGEYDETRNLFIPSEEPITKTETQNSNLTFENRTMLAKVLVGQTDCGWGKPTTVGSDEDKEV